MSGYFGAVISVGVGDPSVCSVVGVPNVDVALLLLCHILFVGMPSIGAALDNTVQCRAYSSYKTKIRLT